MTLSELKKLPYTEYDCYGLTRLVRHHLYNRPLMPWYRPHPPKREASEALVSGVKAYRRTSPVPGAFVACWRGRLCIHVAAVVNIDGRTMILETGEQHGPRLVAVRAFERRYLRVEYYDDPSF